jgi:hypothetical protein
LWLRNAAPARGDDLEDLVGGPQARRQFISLETPDGFMISPQVRGANPFVANEFGKRSGEPIGGAV